MTGPFPAVELDGDGAHPAAWRWSGRAPGAVLGGAALRDAVHGAERAGFAFVTFADSPLPPSDGLDAAGRLEAGTRAAFVATTTDTVGLAPTLHVATTEPFHLSAQLAALDHATRGRAGWVVGTANDAASAATIGAAPLDAPALAREARDVIDAARALWDSWEDEAVIRDRATGRYLDPDRVHHVDVVGSRFTVKGPLITPRPPQGHVVVLAPVELDLGDRADIALTGTPVRAAGSPLTVLDLDVVLDADSPAAVRLGALDAETPWEPTGRMRHVGSVETLLDLLRELDGVVDGVRFHPAVHAVDLVILQREVLPALRRTAGATLRETLGLPRPVNRLVTAGVLS